MGRGLRHRIRDLPCFGFLLSFLLSHDPALNFISLCGPQVEGLTKGSTSFFRTAAPPWGLHSHAGCSSGVKHTVYDTSFSAVLACVLASESERKVLKLDGGRLKKYLPTRDRRGSHSHG